MKNIAASVPVEGPNDASVYGIKNWQKKKYLFILGTLSPPMHTTAIESKEREKFVRICQELVGSHELKTLCFV